MRRRIVAVALGVCLVGLGGCANLHEVLFPGMSRQNASLLDQVDRLEAEREELLDQNQVLKADRDGLQASLNESQREARTMSQLVGELKAEQQKLERQTLELKNLLKDLPGVSLEARSEGNFIVMESEILFELGKVDLNPDATTSLDRVADYLLTNPELAVRIDGHTDGVPIRHSPWKDNYHLGAMRAHSVMRYLGGQGVGAERMFLAGFGPNRPRVPPEAPDEPVGANRRVEILLLPEGLRSISDILEGFQD
ncbi:MAG: OmpA family protein [Candidatus Brocadiae bacterium]|nr:OmpA family protein [Candidatus Brocadiia bacterium]